MQKGNVKMDSAPDSMSEKAGESEMNLMRYMESYEHGKRYITRVCKKNEDKLF